MNVQTKSVNHLECAVFQSYLAAAVMECIIVHQPTLPILYLHEPGTFCWTPILWGLSGRCSALGRWLWRDKQNEDKLSYAATGNEEHRYS